MFQCLSLKSFILFYADQRDLTRHRIEQFYDFASHRAMWQSNTLAYFESSKLSQSHNSDLGELQRVNRGNFRYVIN